MVKLDNNGVSHAMRSPFLSLRLSQCNDYCVNCGNKTTKSKEADKVRQKLNEKPLNHLWHQSLLPNAIAVSDVVKGDEVC